VKPSMFSYVALESGIPKNHPIHKIRRIVDTALEDLESTFDEMYDNQGRPSIPPEQLLQALLLQILFTIRPECQLMERIDSDLLLRWFVGLGIDDPAWNHSTFPKNRERLIWMDAVVNRERYVLTIARLFTDFRFFARS
jgi:transposase